MPDPSHSIGGDNVHESKVRTSPSQEEVQSWKKDDDDHGRPTNTTASKVFTLLTVELHSVAGWTSISTKLSM